MNPKFFDVKKEKQDAIINAALMIFAENGYKKASTDNIVKAAGISKGLLFHYFISKQGVYEFIYDYSIKYTMLELSQTINKKETDFFAIQRMIELTKLRVMKNYPYMQQFLNNVKYETHPDALKIIQESENSVDEAYAQIYKRADMSKFNRPVDAQKIIRMIGWMSDGFIRDKFRNGTPEPDSMNSEFAQYLSMLREHFYGNDAGNSELIIEATEAVRDDSVMDSMKSEMIGEPVSTVSAAAFAVEKAEDKPAVKEPAITIAASNTVRELSFEERLALGKKSVYYQEPEEKKEDKPAAEAKPEADTKPAEPAVSVVNVVSLDEQRAPENADTEKASGTAVAAEAAVKESPSENEEAAKSEAAAAAEETAVSAEKEEKEEPVKTVIPDKEDEAVIPAKEPAVSTEAAAKAEEMPVNTPGPDTSGPKVKVTVEEEPEEPEGQERVVACLPETDINFFEVSRLDDFSYGSDERGGRGIPYDSSGNVQIFVEDDDDYEDDYEDEYEDDEDYGDDAVKQEEDIKDTEAAEKPGSQSPVQAPSKENDPGGQTSVNAGDSDTAGSKDDSGEGVAGDDDKESDKTEDDNKEAGSSGEASAANEEDGDSPDNTAAGSEDNKAGTAGDYGNKADMDIDLDDLSEKIMSHTDKESKEQERVKELESMGPAPVLPDINPESINSAGASVDEDNEDVHIYRPLSF